MFAKTVGVPKYDVKILRYLTAIRVPTFVASEAVRITRASTRHAGKHNKVSTKYELTLLGEIVKFYMCHVRKNNWDNKGRYKISTLSCRNSCTDICSTRSNPSACFIPLAIPVSSSTTLRCGVQRYAYHQSVASHYSTSCAETLISY